MKISSAGITNVGQKRQNNEDSYLVNDRIGQFDATLVEDFRLPFHGHLRSC